MSQPRQFGMMGGGHQQINDTTFTKIFVGGLPWETQRDTMRRYFEQFGEILEAVVITDKNTGRSKGYGFVTFKDPDAAVRACQIPSPVIDGRRANCNLASLGANKSREPAPQHGPARFRPASGLITPPPYQASSSAFVNQPTGQYAFPYSAYGYTGYSQDSMYPMGYYNVYGGQQFSPYYMTGASSQAGVYQNLYPYYPQYAERAQAHGLGLQYPPVAQYPSLPQHFNSSGILSLPSSVTVAAPSTVGTVTTTAAVAATASSPAQASGTAPEQNPAT